MAYSKFCMFFCFTCIFSLGCTNKSSNNIPSDSLSELFDDFYEFKLRINPIEASKSGEYKYNDVVADYISDEYQKNIKENYTQFLDALNTIDTNAISPSQHLSMKVMRWDCEIKLQGLNNALVTIASPMYDLPSFELMPLIQMQSLHVYFPQLGTGKGIQPFITSPDYENWLKRVDDYLVFIDTAIAKMKEGISKGTVLPKVLIQRVIPQVESFISEDIENHLFYQPTKFFPSSFTKDEKDRLKKEYREKIINKLIPKYKLLLDFLNEEYLPKGRSTSGIGSLPSGPDCYQYLIKLHTTTNMSANEIHELGKQEVERIKKEMIQAKDEIGYEGDLDSFFEHIRNSKTQKPFNKPAEVIANFKSIRSKIESTLDKIFELKPKADFNIKRTEAFREASASAEYVPGTKDATRPGTFYVPIPDVTNYNKYTDEALFLHEAIPGHHYQLSLQQENQELPAFLHPESMGVFVEGWALYAESLGKELGIYKDPYQYFGMLSMEMHRAIRLVVDSGIHGKGWTREEAIKYSLDNEAETEASITNSIERYMATPGQALSYKIGQLKIQELRRKSEKELGSIFDIRAFHNQILDSGSLPLVLLEEKIVNWISMVKSQNK